VQDEKLSANRAIQLNLLINNALINLVIKKTKNITTATLCMKKM